MIGRRDLVEHRLQSGELALAASDNEKQRRGDRQRDDGGADHAGPEERQPGGAEQQIVEDQRAGDAAGDGERYARRPAPASCA